MLTAWPDLVGTLKWSSDAGYLRAAGILRDIRASSENGSTANAAGWGFTTTGKILLPAQSAFLFEVSYGKGVGSYYNDGPINGVYNPVTDDIDLLPVFGYYAGINHSWSPVLISTIMYASQNAETLDSQPVTDGNKSQYFSINLVWRPVTSLLIGAEFLRGSRHDISGAEGKVSRLQLTSKFSF